MNWKDEIASLLAAVKSSGYDGDNLLPVLTSLAVEPEASRGFSDETLILAHLAMFSGDPRHLPLAISLATRLERHDLLAQLRGIEESFREPEAMALPIIRRPARVDEKFREHCSRRGITILRQLQVGIEGREACRSVFLCLDTDGIVKIWKELRLPETSRLCLIADESEVYERVGPVSGIPRYYGTEEVEDILFLRMSVCYGRTLDEFSFLLPDEAAYVVGRLADALAALHAVGVVYNDMRPSNVKINGSDVRLLDLGDAQFIPDNKSEVTTYVHGPRYVAPEVVLRHKALPASDVFQLGVLWHELLTGRHPFSSSLRHEEDYDLARLRDCLANVVRQPADCGNKLLLRMLDADPERRPSAKEVSTALSAVAVPPRTVRTKRMDSASNGSVLFPARIGVPHHGHIDFMARVMELGYDLVVSLDASYVITHMDPLPKWTVMKMIGRSLALRGFDASQIRFVCTPLFKSDDQIGLHYAIMPGISKVVAVASGNPGVHCRFHGWPIIDQKAVFGMEGEPYETRSWGERLRAAVRNGDKTTFNDLIAPGAEEILSFEEMQAWCSGPTLDFVWEPGGGRAVAVLRRGPEELVRQRISAYSTPEDTIVQSLPATFVDRFVRDSVVKVDSKTMKLVFEHTAFEDQNLTINYRLEDA